MEWKRKGIKLKVGSGANGIVKAYILSKGAHCLPGDPQGQTTRGQFGWSVLDQVRELYFHILGLYYSM